MVVVVMVMVMVMVAERGYSPPVRGEGGYGDG